MKVSFVVGLLGSICALPLLQEVLAGVENGELMLAAEKRLPRDAGYESDNRSHVHVHIGDTIVSTDERIAQDESIFFVSALFRKYSYSDTLNMDGFSRLLCILGLVPSREATTNDTGADDISDGLLDCGKITFEKVKAIFQDEDEHAREHDHGDEHNHKHSTNHSDHDHYPNRNIGANQSDSHDHDHAAHAHHAHDDHVHDDHAHDDHAHDDHVHDHAHDDHVHEDGDSSNSTHHTHSRSKRVVVDTDASQIHFHSNHTECIEPSALLEQFHIQGQTINKEQFLLLCPALVYQLASGSCQYSHRHDQDQDHIDHHHSGHNHDHDHNHGDHDDSHSRGKVEGLPAFTGKVWGFSIAAVLVISLAGLLGVAAIPIMQKVFYNHLLQFLVAVAVGALSGDALLHLLPHAISKNLGQDHSSHDHDSGEDAHMDSVWKGLTALLCIFFFFLIERILTIVTEKKRRKKEMSRLKKKRCERLCDVEKSGAVGAKLSAHADGDYTDCEQMVMVVHPNRALKGYADATHDIVMHQCDESLSQTDQAFDADEEHLHNELGHSHGHGHGHMHCDSVPGSVAAVAWMVIFGDGIHNFSDGLAIGAAFANSVTGGISTSIAIFCHELPHEIGDFAVLLRAGMSVKQAIVYNCVSSVLCFLGMLIGVAIGNIHNASLWIFSGVGGMFLYISMVDMLPEMTAVDTKKGENQYLHLLLQAIGMMFGASIMLVIAVYEHDLQQLLD